MVHERFVSSFDGTELFVSTEGNGPPVVLCDGIGCDGYIWKYLVPQLVQQHEVVRWHYRGHGRSDMPATRTAISITDHAEDLDHVLDSAVSSPVVLFAHSMGCQVVLEYALQHQERVAGIVLLCGTYGNMLRAFHDHWVMDRFFPYLRLAVHRFPQVSRSMWKFLCRSPLTYEVAIRTEANKELIRRPDFEPYFEHLATMDVQLFADMVNHANQHTTESRIGGIHVPTLVAAGDRDLFTPFWVSRRMHQMIPDSEFLHMPQGTHCAPIELPHLLSLRVDKFLDQHQLRGAKPVRKAKKAVTKRATKTAASRRKPRRQGA